MDYTIPSTYFHIKIYFLINLFNLQQALDWASIPGEHRVLDVSFLRHRAQYEWMAGLIPKSAVAL